jgi:hypothetical protein
LVFDIREISEVNQLCPDRIRSFNAIFDSFQTGKGTISSYSNRLK